MIRLRQILASQSQPREQGFSLIELMVVIAMVGILSAIATPTWLGFMRQQKVTSVNDEISLKLQEAQRKARQTKLPQSMSVRVREVDDEDILEAIVHRNDIDLSSLDDSQWQKLGENKNISGREVLLFTNLSTGANTPNDKISENTYPQPRDTDGPVSIAFDQTGALDDSPEFDENKGLIIGAGVRGDSSSTVPTNGSQRCVIVRTLLGAMELGVGEDECQPW